MPQAINVGSKRIRKASRAQQDINNENDENELARISRQEKELARKKKRLLKQYEESDENDLESQDEEDQGYGKKIGGGFTSTSISSQGVVHTLGGARPLKKRQLMREDAAMSDSVDHSSSRQPLHTLTINNATDNLLDFNDGKDDSLNPPIHEDSTPTTSPLPQPVGPVKSVKLAPAPFRDGKIPGKNIKAADYEEDVEKMLLNAMHEFSCLVLTDDAFPADECQIKWARTVWKNTCNKVDAHYELSHRMIKLITERGSWARGLLKDAARKHFKDYFKFKKGMADETKTYNKDLCITLLTEDAFHHKDPEAGVGFAESLIIAEILEAALFQDSSDYGVRFSAYFSPIPLTLLALVITIIEFLIEEYATGEKIKATFREKTNKDRFKKHLKRVKEWADINERVTANIRAKLFKRLMKRAGALHSPLHIVSGMTTGMREKAQQALNARTGETDSEAD